MKRSKDGMGLPSALPRSHASRLATEEECKKQARDLESIAQLVENMIDKFEKEEERQFYREVVQSYRGASRELLRSNAPAGRHELSVDGVRMTPIRVLVIDDYEPWRAFVSLVIQRRPELVIVGEVSDGLEAVQKTQELQPELILIDVGLPTLNGIEVARRIRKLSPDFKILFVSQELSEDVRLEALSTGAQGYIVKTNAKYLLAAMDAVLAA
jgi:CheY-like chemotaxis protein